jgi:acyl carrier protein
MEKITYDNFVINFKILLSEDELIKEDTIFKKLKSWDSLFVLELIMMIDEKYNIKIPPEIINSSNTVSDLYVKVLNHNND